MSLKNTNTVQVKRDILWRVYLCFIVVVIVCGLILGKAFYIQQVQGNYWRSMSDSLHQKIEETEADRGTIYSEDGQMLSTSIPQFDIYVDFAADGLRNKGGKIFKENLDSLSFSLAQLFKDRTESEYRNLLLKGYKNKARYFSLKKKLNFRQYQELRRMPLVRLGRNKSGFIAEVRNIRLNPYQMLAYRTIGLDRENSQKVGLEETYDSVLKGTTGKRLVRNMGGGIVVPVEDDMEIDPENGKDILTTLDIHIQEITENALNRMMVSNEAVHGCAIVMEVKTGKIKALANLGIRPDGSYWEDFNYALAPGEPGSTFKLATLLSVLEDKKTSLNQLVNLEGGTWQTGGRTVYDSEKHGLNEVSVKRAFELSSNVGMAKLVQNSYGSAPSAFISHLRKLGMDTLTGIDLAGERSPVIHKPKSKFWSATTLPWMAFGYSLAVTPMHTAMLYNAIANEGKMVRPYLVTAIKEDGQIIKQFEPFVVHDSICSRQTLSQLTECLKGVCSEPGATGYKLFKDSPYKVAGKTGTALIADGAKGYSERIYQASFAGYFPAENPQYTCVVVIRNKPRAAKIYGGAVAGPVFKEIADRLYSLYVQDNNPQQFASIVKTDSTWFNYEGMTSDVKKVLSKLQVNYTDSGKHNREWTKIYKHAGATMVSSYAIEQKKMPHLQGMGLKDAIYLCENLGLKVNVKGKGKVTAQSVLPGEPVAKGQVIKIELNSPGI